jgi:hypothetical protein
MIKETCKTMENLPSSTRFHYIKSISIYTKFYLSIDITMNNIMKGICQVNINGNPKEGTYNST